MNAKLDKNLKALITIKSDLVKARDLIDYEVDEIDSDEITESFNIFANSTTELAKLIVVERVNNKAIYKQLLEDIDCAGKSLTMYDWDERLKNYVESLETEIRYIES